MVQDVRVVLIKLADHLQALRYVGAQPTDRELRRATARAHARHLRAAREPARRVAAQVGARGSRVPHPRARHLQAHRARCSTRSALDRERYIESVIARAQGRACARRHRGRGHRPAQAHLQHLQEDAAQGRRLRGAVRRARGARAGRRREGLLRRARARASPLVADPEGVRRLHRASPRATTTARCTRR